MKIELSKLIIRLKHLVCFPSNCDDTHVLTKIISYLELLEQKNLETSSDELLIINEAIERNLLLEKEWFCLSNATKYTLKKFFEQENRNLPIKIDDIISDFWDYMDNQVCNKMNKNYECDDLFTLEELELDADYISGKIMSNCSDSNFYQVSSAGAIGSICLYKDA